MNTPDDLPEWYLIPREETGINARPSGPQEGTNQPPFGDLFSEQIPKIMAEIREFFVDWPAHIKAMLDTGIDWLQTVADLDLEWLKSLLHRIVDTIAAVFDVSSWVAFLDTIITSAANLVTQSFATVFDWIASLLLGLVTFVESACNLDLTWLRNLIGTATSWSKANVNLASQADFVDGVTNSGTTTNPLMGILFGPMFRIMHACQVFGSDVWHAITTFWGSPSPAAWTTMVNTINTAWATMVDAILGAWGSSKTHTDFASPAQATEVALKNNPVTGWLWGNSFGGGTWLNTAIRTITDPITEFFDDVRRYINQMIQPLHWGYFDANWAWVKSLTTPTSVLPGGGTAVMTSGRSDDDAGGVAANTDPRIPAAPTGLLAVPSIDITSSNFPAGWVTYAISAVKNGVEGPAALVKAFAGTLIPPNTSGRVDLSWNSVADLDGWRIYRQVDATFLAEEWRLVATPTVAGSLLSPVSDKTPRGGGTTASPKTDAALVAEVVTDRITLNQQNAQNFQISALTGGYRNPIWACRYPVGDVSYPEVLNMAMTVYDPTGTPAPRSGNAAYVLGQSPWLAQAAVYDVLQNESRGGYIVISNTAVMDKLGMFGAAVAGLNNLYLDLFRVEMGVEAVRIFSVNCTSEISANTGYFEVDIPGGGILAQAGERYLVRLRNKSTVAGTAQVRGIGGLTGSTSVGLKTTNATDTDKTTYTAANLGTHAVSVTPFCLFASQGQVATDQLYADDFNRSGMGALWYLQSTSSDQMGIAFGTASYTGSTDGHQHALYTRPLASDRMWTEGNFYNINSSTPEGLLLCCNRDLTQMVYLAVNNTTARIYSGSATSLTQRASVSTLFNSVPWQFYYDPATKKYTVLKDGKDIGLSWTDSGNLMKHGALYRYGGLRISHANLFHGGTIDNWLLKDWS